MSGSDGEVGADAPACGAVEVAVRADVATLMTAHPMAEALAEMSYSLARSIDGGAGMLAAAMNKELRANLLELARLGVDGDDDLDAELSTPTTEEEVD